MTQTISALHTPARDAADAAPTFAALGVPSNLAASLAQRGFDTPFPIQTATLPDTLAGRDVLGRGRTGSGKTLAFALPLVARLTHEAGRKRRPGRPRGLVLAPTRELVTQITETIEPLAKAAGLRVTTVFGGVSQGRQVAALQHGVDIVVAAPGRLEDLMGQRLLFLDAVEITILDEADHMADLGFLPAVRRILDATPTKGQRMLFSATLDNGVDKLVTRYLHDPLRHSVEPEPGSDTAMTHHFLLVPDAGAKKDVIAELAAGLGRRMLFTRTKHQAKRLAKQLTTAGIPAVDLHGNLSQNARQRNLAAFHSGEVKVLVATDIAARGIHVEDVELVVHVDPPAEHKAYVHRSGRTARAGASGDVVTVVLPEQRRDAKALARAAAITPHPHEVMPGSPVVANLVGDVAPRVAPQSSGRAGGSRPPAGAGQRSANTSGHGSTAPAPTGARRRPRRRRGGRPTHGS